MSIRTRLLGALMASVLGVASSAFGQPVTFTGKLQIGFGDTTNFQGYSANNAMPICAGAGPLVNTATIGTTLGTLLVNAVGSAAPGAGGAMTFNAVGAGFGGAQQRVDSTCNVAIPPFANPRLRSRTQLGSAHFPGRKGHWSSMITQAPVPATPTATYMVSAAGGHPHPISVMTWTTTNETGPPGLGGTPAPTAMVTHMGSAFEAAGVLSTTSPPLRVRVQPGAGRFGGGIPYSGYAGVHRGQNYLANWPHFFPPTFGDVTYDEGTIPYGPQFFGTSHLGIDTTMTPPWPFPYTPPATTPTFTKGFLFRRQNATIAARTPGGSTQHQHGAVLTLNGGNTNTAQTGSFPPSIAIITPVEYVGYNFRWTTGAVTYSDQQGDFRTVRKAQGYDVAVMPSTAVAGETRRIQLVTPWSAAVRNVGSFGFAIEREVFGGVAVLRIDVIPAPEPGFALGLGVGALAFGFLRRRSPLA